MKKIKDRPFTPLLAQQMKDQEIRIRNCGIDAYIWYNLTKPTFKGSLLSTRYENKTKSLR